MKTTLTATSLILLFLFSLTSPMATVLSERPATDHTTGRSTACSVYVCINEVIPNGGTNARSLQDLNGRLLSVAGTVQL